MYEMMLEDFPVFLGADTTLCSSGPAVFISDVSAISTTVILRMRPLTSRSARAAAASVWADRLYLVCNRYQPLDQCMEDVHPLPCMSADAHRDGWCSWRLGS